MKNVKLIQNNLEDQNFYQEWFKMKRIMIMILKQNSEEKLEKLKRISEININCKIQKF